jgi:hypothetical protein
MGSAHEDSAQEGQTKVICIKGHKSVYAYLCLSIYFIFLM